MRSLFIYEPGYATSIFFGPTVFENLLITADLLAVADIPLASAFRACMFCSPIMCSDCCLYQFLRFRDLCTVMTRTDILPENTGWYLYINTISNNPHVGNIVKK